MERVNKNIRIVYTLTSRDIGRQTWHGRTGYIDEKMIKKEISHYKERTFYICGPPKMVGSLVNVLNNKVSMQEDKIKTENFVGY